MTLGQALFIGGMAWAILGFTLALTTDAAAEVWCWITGIAFVFAVMFLVVLEFVWMWRALG